MVDTLIKAYEGAVAKLKQKLKEETDKLNKLIDDRKLFPSQEQRQQLEEEIVTHMQKAEGFRLEAKRIQEEGKNADPKTAEGRQRRNELQKELIEAQLKLQDELEKAQQKEQQLLDQAKHEQKIKDQKLKIKLLEDLIKVNEARVNELKRVKEQLADNPPESFNNVTAEQMQSIAIGNKVDDAGAAHFILNYAGLSADEKNQLKLEQLNQDANAATVDINLNFGTPIPELITEQNLLNQINNAIVQNSYALILAPFAGAEGLVGEVNPGVITILEVYDELVGQKIDNIGSALGLLNPVNGIELAVGLDGLNDQFAQNGLSSISSLLQEVAQEYFPTAANDPTSLLIPDPKNPEQNLVVKDIAQGLLILGGFSAVEALSAPVAIVAAVLMLLDMVGANRKDLELILTLERKPNEIVLDGDDEATIKKKNEAFVKRQHAMLKEKFKEWLSMLVQIGVAAGGRAAAGKIGLGGGKLQAQEAKVRLAELKAQKAKLDLDQAQAEAAGKPQTAAQQARLAKLKQEAQQRRIEFELQKKLFEEMKTKHEQAVKEAEAKLKEAQDKYKLQRTEANRQAMEAAAKALKNLKANGPTPPKPPGAEVPSTPITPDGAYIAEGNPVVVQPAEVTPAVPPLPKAEIKPPRPAKIEDVPPKPPVDPPKVDSTPVEPPKVEPPKVEPPKPEPPKPEPPESIFSDPPKPDPNSGPTTVIEKPDPLSFEFLRDTISGIKNELAEIKRQLDRKLPDSEKADLNKQKAQLEKQLVDLKIQIEKRQAELIREGQKLKAELDKNPSPDRVAELRKQFMELVKQQDELALNLISILESQIRQFEVKQVQAEMARKPEAEIQQIEADLAGLIAQKLQIIPRAIKALERQIKDLEKRIAEEKDPVVKANLEADLRKLLNKVRSLKAELNSSKNIPKPEAPQPPNQPAPTPSTGTAPTPTSAEAQPVIDADVLSAAEPIFTPDTPDILVFTQELTNSADLPGDSPSRLNTV